jgi:hypothetical protein
VSGPTATPQHRPRGEGLAHPADTSSSNLADATALLSRRRLSKPMPWWRAVERGYPTGRERMNSPTLHTLQDPILAEVLALLSGGFPNPLPTFTLRGLGFRAAGACSLTLMHTGPRTVRGRPLCCLCCWLSSFSLSCLRKLSMAPGTPPEMASKSLLSAFTPNRVSTCRVSSAGGQSLLNLMGK